MSQLLLAVLRDVQQGVVTIDGLDLDRANVWSCVRKDELWNAPPLRGDNTILQGVTGRMARSKVEDENTISLPMLFGGGYAYDTGNPVGAAERYKQLSINLDFFESQTVALPGTAGETRTVVFAKPDGTSLTGDVQVTRPWAPVWLEAPFARAVLTLVIPDGRLT